MVWKILIMVVVTLIYVFYRVYLKDFIEVRKTFMTLKKFLSTRDALLLKLLPELKNTIDANKILSFVEERRLNFESSYNNAIKSDVKLNKELKTTYAKISKTKLNSISLQLFNTILKTESELKSLRAKYNETVEKYNNNLVKHNFVCLKVIKMKPLDTYKVMQK